MLSLIFQQSCFRMGGFRLENDLTLLCLVLFSHLIWRFLAFFRWCPKRLVSPSIYGARERVSSAHFRRKSTSHALLVV